MGMTDNLSPSDRKKTMAAVKGKGTKLERKLWSMLAGMHLRDWRKNPAGISGNPDVIFPERRVAIFVDGCFWHRCPTCNRPLPQANREYWESKLNRNVELGAVHQMVLSQEGMASRANLGTRIQDFLLQKRGSGQDQSVAVNGQGTT